MVTVEVKIQLRDEDLQALLEILRGDWDDISCEVVRISKEGERCTTEY